MKKNIMISVLALLLTVVSFGSSANAAGQYNKLTPTVQCLSILDVDPESGFTQYFAHFGYVNDGSKTVTVPIGANNTVEPWSTNGYNQPTVFSPGVHNDVYVLSMSSTSQTQWKLGDKVAIATPATPLCK